MKAVSVSFTSSVFRRYGASRWAEPLLGAAASQSSWTGAPRQGGKGRSLTTATASSVDPLQIAPPSLPHDIGGSRANFGPIDRPSNETLLAWEQQCHALFAVLGSKQILNTDELRRAIESLTPAQYNEWSYYEKWSAGMTILLLEHNILSHDELQQALFGATAVEDAAKADDFPPPAPCFATGDAVRVKRHAQGVEWKRPHNRTPGYVYGIVGTIERVCGRHGDPSWLAFGIPGAPLTQLYRVCFLQSDLWPEHAGAESKDVVEVEIYEHWLESADECEPPNYPDQAKVFDHSCTGDDCLWHNDFNHHHYHHQHVHEARPMVEERAIQREGPPRPGQELFEAIKSLLLQKNIVAPDEIRIMCERLDTAGRKMDGASLVLKAWQDSFYRERLLADPVAAAAELGVATSNPNAPTVLTVVPNTRNTHNLVVCTLCSCYPSGLLGVAPSWYKSRAYRARAVRDPRAVLTEFGCTVPMAKQIRTHDSTANHRYLVLPEQPAGTENWSAEELRAIITRDTMIGVAVPSSVRPE